MGTPPQPTQFILRAAAGIRKYASWMVAGVILLAASLLYAVLTGQMSMLAAQKHQLESEVVSAIRERDAVKNEDQYVKNAQLSEKIRNIQATYGKAVSVYEVLADLRAEKADTVKLDPQFAYILSELSKEEWSTASAALATLSADLKAAEAKLAQTVSVPANVPANNAPPGSGYSRQSVESDVGSYVVDIIAADMGSTKIIVDTASDHDCSNDCPVKSLADYVAQNGAFAGVNGSYFCPADYPSCSTKKNSFDTLLMNKNKVYFNSDNNVYSTVPAVIFLSGSMRFVGRSLEWGRDTSPDGVIANQGLLLSGGTIVYGDDGDPKKGSVGNRSFVGNKGNTAYIGVVHGATVAEVAHVLKTLGLDGALNLDSGGSTALWSGGYKAGPGRNIPNAILFVRK